MPETNAHIKRAESNFSFLNFIKDSDFNDWKVTATFYTALHIINAFIYDKVKLSYRTHKKVEEAINPYSMSPCKLDEDTYSSYQSLFSLSKRSRYMISEKKANNSNETHLIYDKHVARAYRHLDTILKKFPQYSKNIKKIEINNIEIKENELTFFNKK